MPKTLDKKVGEWRDADSKARQIEKSLTLHLLAEGPSPSEAAIRQARLLRKLADEKLKAAIEAMKPAAEASH